jgi:hypothetical protein
MRLRMVSLVERLQLRWAASCDCTDNISKHADTGFQERDALWEVQLDAQELHWQLAAGKIVHFSDVKTLWQRYVQVERDASLNHPDTWTSSTAAAAQAVDMSKLPAGSPQIGAKPGDATTSVAGTVAETTPNAKVADSDSYIP